MSYKIAILASGTGSNAAAIIDYFKDRSDVEFIVGSNKTHAAVLNKAKERRVPTFTFGRAESANGKLSRHLLKENVDWVILAGYLWLIPENLLKAFPNKILNIHPSLLPKYGGKGMYGPRVHEAVIANGEDESGITIHYVNEAYDEGEFITQQSLKVLTDDTPDSLAQRIHKLEHHHYPRVIESLLK